jgi:rhamnose transport system permease protein
MELFVVTIVLLGGISIFGGRGTIAGVVIAVAVLGCLQTALTADRIPSQDQNIVVGALLVASVIVPNSGELYRRARARLRSAAARRNVAVTQAESP